MPNELLRIVISDLWFQVQLMDYFDFGKMWKVHYYSLILIFYGFSLDISFFQ